MTPKGGLNRWEEYGVDGSVKDERGKIKGKRLTFRRPKQE